MLQTSALSPLRAQASRRSGTDVSVARQYAFILGDDGSVERHYLPGSHALNFLLNGALDGGCTVSLCIDPFGKSAAQDALDMSIPVPASLL